MLFFHVLRCELHLLLALLFFGHGFWGPGPWLFCSRVLGSLPWLFLFLHGQLARVSTSLILAKLVVQLSLFPDLKHCVPFFSTCCFSTCCVVNFTCCWHCSSLVTGSGVPVPGCFVHGSSGPFPGCFSFFTASWHVFQPAYNSPPWSESKCCPRSLQTALFWTSHK